MVAMSSENADTERQIALVESFLRALEKQDLEGASALLSEDAVYQNVPLPAARGRDAVIKTLKSFERFVNGFEVKMVNIAARNGVVLTERIDILKGPYVYLDIWVCGTFEIKDDKITLWRDYFDYAQVTSKLVTGPIRKLLGRVP